MICFAYSVVTTYMRVCVCVCVCVCVREIRRCAVCDIIYLGTVYCIVHCADSYLVCHAVTAAIARRLVV